MGIATDLDSTLESHSLYNLSLEKISRNRFRDALGHLVEALRIAPSNPVYLSYFGLCLAHAERDNLGKVYRLKGENRAAHAQFLRAWEIQKGHPAAASELTRMGIRRPPFIRFLSRKHWANRYLGLLRANLERKLVGHRQC